MRTGSERDHAGLLGMTPNPKDDMLQFPRKAIVIPPEVKFTKRQVETHVFCDACPTTAASCCVFPLI